MNYLYNHIEKIRKRPGIYLGKLSITALYHYLNGYREAMYEHNIDDIKTKSLLPLSFGFFHDFTANYYGWYESTMGWCNIILREVEGNEEKGLETFYELFDLFKGLTIKKCYFAKLNDQNIHYHYTDKCAPRRGLSADCDELIPLYEDPVEVYMIELSSEGYLCLVNTKSKHHLEQHIFKSKAKTEEYLKSCFGKSISYEQRAINNIKFTKKYSEYAI